MSEKNYYIYINGSKVAVSKELHDYDRQSERKITYAEVDRKIERFKVDRENLKAEFIPSLEDSLDRLSESGEQFSEKDSDFRNSIEMRLDLKNALSKLSESERDLIYRLYFLCESEREIAEEYGVFSNVIHKKKCAVLAKLHKLLKN